MFNFEECELINSFFEGDTEDLTKEKAIKRIKDAAEYTRDKEIIKIARSIIVKLESLTEYEFMDIIRNIPLCPWMPNK